MKAIVDRGGCISCGVCASMCPEAFRMADDGLAESYLESVPEELTESVREAADSCPVSVISLSDD